jgi:hypothetical protein
LEGGLAAFARTIRAVVGLLAFVVRHAVVG